MTVDKELKGSTLLVKVAGRLDTMTSPELEKELSGQLAGVEELIFDLADLEYVSSAGLRVILANYKLMSKQGSMIVRNVSDEIMEVFELTGFTDILNIE